MVRVAGQNTGEERAAQRENLGDLQRVLPSPHLSILEHMNVRKLCEAWERYILKKQVE